jgi:predicted cation transporter
MSYELAGILITVIIQALYIAYKIGKFEEKLIELEKKQDKHNNLIERMVKVESKADSAHHRIDTIEDKLL